jgi:hypothetical protein
VSVILIHTLVNKMEKIYRRLPEAIEEGNGDGEGVLTGDDLLPWRHRERSDGLVEMETGAAEKMALDDPLRHYLNEVRKHPLLTKQEEIDYANR